MDRKISGGGYLGVSPSLNFLSLVTVRERSGGFKKRGIIPRNHRPKSVLNSHPREWRRSSGGF
ncbi:MAG: hypothetical protein LBP62_05250 [Clostridiales bacterium]|nr:hypothetical protein [Clostridiales bacterium]